MEDYYRLLEVDYEASVEAINNAYQQKISEYKSLPFLSDLDKNNFKEIKKAIFIFNNKKHKKTYDEYIKNKIKTQSERSSRKTPQNQNYLVDRIFNFQSNPNYNLKHNELLRPKNVGLTADDQVEYDKPLDYDESADFKPFNFDS
jgi:DnaJ-class molecular chaperone